MDNDQGQSLIEVIVAATVGIMVVSALTFATIFSIRNASFAKNSAQATKLAQEGMERVRSGRDRNQSINSSGALGAVTSWTGDTNGNGAIWSYRINGNCGNTTATPPTYCYFNINTSGRLQYLAAASVMPSLAESIGLFKRVVILSDDTDYQAQKTVTVIVTWTDFACGTTPNCHESKLTSVLRKL